MSLSIHRRARNRYRNTMALLAVWICCTGCGAAVPSGSLPSDAPEAPPAVRPAGIHPLPAAPIPATPAGYRAVAASTGLVLFVNRTDGQIAVWQRATHQWWDSRVQGFSGRRGWRRSLGSAFLLQVVNAAFNHLSPVNSAGAGRGVVVRPMRGGAAVTYTLDRYGLAVTIDYLLQGDSLVWRLTPGGIVRQPHGARVGEILPLPYFAAFPQGTGTLLLPDGAGARVAGFDPNGPYTAGYRARVYGSGLPPWQTRGRPHANLAAFGVLRGSAAVAVSATRGASLATVDALPAGDTAAMNRIRFAFRLRRPYRTYVNQFTATIAYARARARRTLEVRYTFLGGTHGGAAGVAAAWRHSLQAAGTLTSVRRPTRGALHILLRMAVAEPAPGGWRPVVLTTFAQAGRVLAALHRAGVGPIDATLLGWTPGGYRLGGPASWSASPRLGGAAGLARLQAQARANGDRILLGLNPVDAYSRNGGFSPWTQVLTLPDHLPLEHRATGHYLLNGQATLGSLRTALTQLPRMPIPPGVALLGIGRNLPAQTSQGATGLSRYWRAAALDASHTAPLQVQGGNAYLFAAGGTVLDAPTGDGGLPYEAAMTPLWEMTVHGTLPYVAAPVNFSADPTRALLRAEAVGALPALELSAAGPAALRHLQPNPYFALGYRHWLPLARMAAAASRHLAGVSGLRLTGYRVVSPGVTRTSFGGTTAPARVVLINTTRHPVQTNHRRVPAETALWLGGGKR